MLPRPVCLTLALTLAATTGVAGAQEPWQRPPEPRRLTVATNPLAPAFGAYSAEAEAALGRRGWSVGVGGTYDTDRNNTSWVQGKLKLYPGRHALAGLAAGVTAGLIQTTGDPDCGPLGCGSRTERAATVGGVVDWNWLLGRRRSLLVGVGVGVQRVLHRGRESDGRRIGDVQPDGRLVVGWAF
jgi:hypothetical protein